MEVIDVMTLEDKRAKYLFLSTRLVLLGQYHYCLVCKLNHASR